MGIVFIVMIKYRIGVIYVLKKLENVLLKVGLSQLRTILKIIENNKNRKDNHYQSNQRLRIS